MNGALIEDAQYDIDLDHRRQDKLRLAAANSGTPVPCPGSWRLPHRLSFSAEVLTVSSMARFGTKVGVRGRGAWAIMIFETSGFAMFGGR